MVYTDYRPVPLQHYLFPAGADGLYLVVDEKVCILQFMNQTCRITYCNNFKVKIICHLKSCMHNNNIFSMYVYVYGQNAILSRYVSCG